MTEFDIIRNEGRLLYEYIRGSHLYGLMEQSTIREQIDKDFVNQLMIDIRNKQLGV